MADLPAERTPEGCGLHGEKIALDSESVAQILCCFLPIEHVAVVARCSHKLYVVAKSDEVWAPKVATLIEDNADVCVETQHLPSVSFVERYRHLSSSFPVWRALQAVKRFEEHGYESLRELGVLSKPGFADASFEPFEAISLPITAQAALELLRCFSALKGKGKPCVYKKAAVLLGRANLQQTLRVAEGTYEKHKKKTRTKEPLGNFLLSSWPAARDASSSSSPAGAGVNHYVLVKAVGKTKAQRAVERFVLREAAKHAKTKWQRDDAREGWAKTSAECAELRLQASEAARISKLVARLQKELAGKIDVTQQRVLEAQVLEADRKLRASVRQQQDAETRSRRVVEHLRLQSAAAEAERQALGNTAKMIA